MALKKLGELLMNGDAYSGVEIPKNLKPVRPPAETKNVKRKDTKRGRWYAVPVGGIDEQGTVDLPSVTFILGVVGKPALMNWAAKMEREMCIQAAADFYEDCARVSPMSRAAYTMSLNERIGKLRSHQREVAKAQEIGAQAHALIEWHTRKMMGQEVGPEPTVREEALLAFMSWQDWAKEVDLKPILTEQVIYSLTYGYAGTCDLFANIEGVPTLVDYKSSKAIYLTESGCQASAYAAALREMGHGDAKRCMIVRLPKTLEDPQFEVMRVDEVVAGRVGLISPDLAQAYLFQKFLATYELWKWVQANDDAYWEKKKE